MRVTLTLEDVAAVRAALPEGGKKLTAVAVYVAIVELAARRSPATCATIAEQAGGSPATVYNYLEPLETAGVVEVERQPRGPWTYLPRQKVAA